MWFTGCLAGFTPATGTFKCLLPTDEGLSSHQPTPLHPPAQSRALPVLPHFIPSFAGEIGLLATPGVAGSCQGWIQAQQLSLIGPSTAPSKGRSWKIVGGGKERGHGGETGGKQLGEKNPSWVTAPEILPRACERGDSSSGVRGAWQGGPGLAPLTNPRRGFSF